MIDYRERRLKFWCQKVLPLVYDESLSYYELLCKIMKHLSEAETDVSALETWLSELDAEAVKKIYSEYPLIAEKDGNTVTLRRRDGSKAPVTTFANEHAIIDNPISVTISAGGEIGSLNPDDENAPQGVTYTEASATINISDATEDSRGVMSANDKTKINRLFNTWVEAGDNIVVTTETASNNDKTYTVSVDPNFEPSVKEWSLTGDEWEWNACLNGGLSGAYYSTAQYPSPAVWYGTIGSAPMSPSENLNSRMVRNGVALESMTESQVNKYGYVYGAESTMPFTRLENASTPTDGEVYFTTKDPIRIKCQMVGTSVANRQFKIYLGTNQVAGQNSPVNIYKADGNYYYPNTSNRFTPAEYIVTTDSNGYFDVTIPAGLTAIAYNVNGSLPPVYTGDCRQLAIVADGDPNELYGVVKISQMKVAIKTVLNAQ